MGQERSETFIEPFGQEPGDSKFHRHLGWFSLLTMSLGTVIGSGWLLLPAVAASYAGVASILSWIFGGLAVLVVAVVYAELGAAWPAAGAVALYPRLSHGSFTGHLAGWAALISYAIIPPAEAVAVTRYAGSFIPAFVTPERNLSPFGLAVAIAILAAISVLNYFGVRYLAHFQNWITSLKYIPIILFIAGAGYFAFHSENFTAFGPFAAHGGSGIMVGVASTIFAYIGFRQALDFGAEAKRPGRDLPLAVILTVLISLVTYVLLAVLFIGALNWQGLAQFGVKTGDWSTLASLPAPLYNVAAAAGLGAIAWLIFIDGIVSPNGPNATNVGSVPRVAYTIAESGTLPRFFLHIHPHRRTPGWGLLACFLLEVFFLLMTTGGYSALISAVNVAFMVGYAIGPVSFGVLRITAPHHKRPFRLPLGGFWAPLAFVLSSLILYWSRWPDTGETLGVLLIGVIVYYFYLWRGRVGRDTLRFGAWLVVYLIAMAALSYFGDPGFGGTGALSSPWDLAVVVVVSLGIYYWGVRQGVAFHAAHGGGPARAASR